MIIVAIVFFIVALALIATKKPVPQVAKPKEDFVDVETGISEVTETATTCIRRVRAAPKLKL